VCRCIICCARWLLCLRPAAAEPNHCRICSYAPQVGYFWLTNGLAFTPVNGSALYIDVRLVPHCSDPSHVRNPVHNPKVPLMYEGRYGEEGSAGVQKGWAVVLPARRCVAITQCLHCASGIVSCCLLWSLHLFAECVLIQCVGAGF
jgi:hypothetical protein